MLVNGIRTGSEPDKSTQAQSYQPNQVMFHHIVYSIYITCARAHTHTHTHARTHTHTQKKTGRPGNEATTTPCQTKATKQVN